MMEVCRKPKKRRKGNQFVGKWTVDCNMDDDGRRRIISLRI
jgi:hypothetical protein